MQNRIIICSSPNKKSIPLYFYLLSNHLSNCGHEVIMIIDQGGGMNFDNFPPNPNLKIISWPNPRPVKFKDYFFLLRLCRSFQPDIVLSQFSSNTISLLISRFFPSTQFFVYWHTMQDQILTDLKFSHFFYNLLMFRKSLVFRISNFRFLTNSNDLKKEIKSIFPFHKNEVSVLNYLMPDPSKFQVIRTFEQREYCISFVSRLDKSKGQREFIKVFYHLLPNFPGLKLKIVGSGPELSGLIGLVEELSLQNDVIFLGECDYQTVLYTMANSLVHVSNSTQEAFGMVNVEAISLGTPILAKKVGGIKDILDPGINGEFIDVSDLDDLLRKIKHLFVADNWTSYSHSSREVFLRKFNASHENFQNQAQVILN